MAAIIVPSTLTQSVAEPSDATTGRRPQRTLVPTQKRKDAAEGEGIEVTAAIAKPQKKKKTSKTGNTDEIVEEASLLPEGSEDPDAAKKKKKEKASKESVCKWLRATHIAKVSNAIEGRPLHSANSSPRTGTSRHQWCGCPYTRSDPRRPYHCLDGENGEPKARMGRIRDREGGTGRLLACAL